MAETYQQAIAAAKKRYAEAMDEVAWDALAISETHGKPLQTVCKDIAGDEWNALRQRAQRKEKTAGQSPDERARRREKERRRIQESEVRSLAKADPGFVAQALQKVAPASLDAVVQEVIDRRIQSAGGTKPSRPKFKHAALEAILTAADRLDEALSAIDDGENTEGLEDALREVTNRVDVLRSRIHGTSISKEAERWLQSVQ